MVRLASIEIFPTINQEKKEATATTHGICQISTPPKGDFVVPRAAAPTYGETWSTEALMNLSCVEHVDELTDAKKHSL